MGIYVILFQIPFKVLQRIHITFGIQRNFYIIFTRVSFLFSITMTPVAQYVQQNIGFYYCNPKYKVVFF